MPAMPHSAAGPRIEPPVSVPIPHRITPAATAAPVPLLDPAVKCSGFHGLCAGGFGRSNDGPPSANSCVVGLAHQHGAGRGQLRRAGGVLFRHVVGQDLRVRRSFRIPAVSTMSFRPIGMPCSGPRGPSCHDRRLGRSRVGHRAILGRQHEGVQRRLGRVQAVQAGLGQLDRRKLASPRSASRPRQWWGCSCRSSAVKP